MALEQLANNASSTLGSSINSSVTSLTVASAATFPSSGEFRILIDTEIMKVTAVSSTTFTVSRGVEGTTAASHTSGAAVTGILTADAMRAYRENNTPLAHTLAARQQRLLIACSSQLIFRFCNEILDLSGLVSMVHRLIW
jgi:hypothetical protein